MYARIPKSFKVAFVCCFVLAISLLLASFYYSRTTVFLWFNKDLGKTADVIFKFMSNLAEGWIWIPYFILLFGWFKKDAVFILLNFFISTILTQVPKNFIWDKVSRPLGSNISDPIHTVDGVVNSYWNSFPSGHTATAFTIFLLTVYYFPNKWVLFFGALYAIACGYSRVYLAQHFPLDIGGGIIVALITLLLSIYYRKYEKDAQKIN
jgi:membrane-associated phospholipid phosphatase